MTMPGIAAARAVTSVDAYDEYGLPQAPLAERFGYAGQPWLPGANLWHYRARMYNPALGRFMQADPVGYDDQVNLYAYARNDPLNRADPSGEQSWDDVQEVLDWAGFTPVGVVTDPVNAIISGARGNWDEAAINLGAMIPVAGDAVKAGDKLRDAARAADEVADRGLAARGLRPEPGSRTFQGQAERARNEAGGNPTIQRGGQDLFRLRPSGHGSRGPTITPYVRSRHVDSRSGLPFINRGRDRPFSNREMRELYRAQQRQGSSMIRTRGSRCVPPRRCPP